MIFNSIISAPHFQPRKKKVNMDDKPLIFSIYSFKFYEDFGIKRTLNHYGEHPAEMLPVFIIGSHLQCLKTHGIKNRNAAKNNKR